MDRPEKLESGSARKDEPVSLSFFNPEAETTKIQGAFLPHWSQEGAVIFFVTFRLADSLPQEKLSQLSAEKAEWLKDHPEPHTEEVADQFHRKFSRKMQQWLDAGYGSMILKKPDVKVLVESALKHFHGQRYWLDEFVVAGNHVHVLVAPMKGYRLKDILHSWKGYTSSQIGKLSDGPAETGRRPLWQQEYWDHLVRSEASLEKFRRYIRGH